MRVAVRVGLVALVAACCPRQVTNYITVDGGLPDSFTDADCENACIIGPGPGVSLVSCAPVDPRAGAITCRLSVKCE
jgi:hypothetical protein